MTDLTLVILAAGRGRRFGALKQLTSFGPGGQLLMDYTLHDARQAGVRQAVLVIGPDQEEAFTARVVDPWRGQLDIRLVVQRLDDLPDRWVDSSARPVRNRPWGTGHAVWAVRDLVPGPFLVANADDFYGRQAFVAVAEFLRREEAPDLFALQSYDLAATLPAEGAFSRGLCEVTPDGWLTGLTEHRALTRSTAAGRPGMVSMNFWGFKPAVFALLEDRFAAFLATEGAMPDQEFFLPAAIQAGLAAGRCRVRVLPPLDSWCGVTGPNDVAAVRERLSALHRSGLYPQGDVR